MSRSKYCWHQFALAALIFITGQPALTGELPNMYDQSLLGAFAGQARYDNSYPKYMKWPQAVDKARIVFDENSAKLAGVDEAFVRNALHTYFVVDGYDWRHCYSQGSGGATGYVELADKSKVRWLVRPGGLALLLYPDGGVVFLAREITTNWKTVAQSPWANLQVERKLYKKDGSNRFFVHVYLTNTSDHKIAFDVSKRSSVFGPNQWAESQKTTRQLIDEIRAIQQSLSKAQSDALIQSMKNPKHAGNASVVTIKPRDVFEYFISFNSGTNTAFEHTKSPYVVLVVDGNMALTDGKSVQVLNRDQSDSTRGEVPLATPISLTAMPSTANILFQD